MNGPDLLDELKRITASLADNYLQLGMLQSQERDKKVRAFFDSSARSVAEREKEADFACLHISTEIIKVRGEVNALVEEKVYVQECLRWLNSQPKAPVVPSRPIIAQPRSPYAGGVQTGIQAASEIKGVLRNGETVQFGAQIPSAV